MSMYRLLSINVMVTTIQQSIIDTHTHKRKINLNISLKVVTHDKRTKEEERNKKRPIKTIPNELTKWR